MKRYKKDLKIRKNRLPQVQHTKYLASLERQVSQVFLKVHKQLTLEIMQEIKAGLLRGGFEGLSKSEDTILKRWVKDIPSIDPKVVDDIEEIILKYLGIMLFVMVGRAAGQKSKKNAKDFLGDKTPPGVMLGAYLDAIDTERAYYRLVYSKEPPLVPKKVIEKSFDIIEKQVTRQLNTSLDSYKNRLIEVVENALSQTRLDTVFNVLDAAHEAAGTNNKQAIIDLAVKDGAAEFNRKALTEELAELGKKAQEALDKSVRVNLGTVSAVGSHQTMVQIYGAESPNIKAVLISVQDGNCCDHCERLSRNRDGSIRVYDLSAFAPAGANNYKKRAEWVLCIPPIHINCRCTLVHIPKGYSIDEHGLMAPGADGEEAS
jgi:hypothetical protein